MCSVLTRRFPYKTMVFVLIPLVFLFGGNTKMVEAQDASVLVQSRFVSDYNPDHPLPLPLPKPTNVSASDGTYADKVRVSWTGSTILPADYYIVFRNTSNTTSGAISWNLGELYILNYYDDTSATPGTTYYYWVKGCYSGSGCSDFSDSDSGYGAVPPLPPTGVSATDGTYTDKVRVSWTSSSGATYYKIFRNNVNATFSATMIEDDDSGSPYDDTSLFTLQGAYYYWVKACNVAGCSDYSSSDTGYRELPPPTGVSASDGTYLDKIRVSWDTSYGATHYRIASNITDTPIGAVYIEMNATESPYDDTDATPGTIQYYWVQACNDVCCSDPEAGISDSGYRAIPLLPPTGVSATDGTYTDKVRVSWASSAGATYYNIIRNTINQTQYASGIGNTVNTFFDDIWGDPATTYYYWVNACNVAGCSDYGGPNTGFRAVLPSPPTSVSATDGSYIDKVRVSWNSSSGATYYEIYRNTSDTTIGADVIEGDCTSPYDDKNAIPGITYFYWVKACNIADCSGYSDSDSGYRAAPPLPPTDFDGDGMADPAKFYASTGVVWWLKSSNSSWDSAWLGSDSFEYVRYSDFDGDGKTDPGKFSSTNGTVWYIKSSTGTWEGKYLGNDTYTYVGGNDFDGDDKSDPTKLLPNGAIWYLKSSTGTWEGFWVGPEAFEYVGGSDFDGDGVSDPAKFIADPGVLWYWESSASGWVGVFLGSDAYSYVSASDFDGDGKTDPAKFYESTGVVWWLQSTTGSWDAAYLGSGSFAFVGGNDFDGDGMTDPAKYDPSTGYLYWLKSSTSTWGSAEMGTDAYELIN